MKKNLIISVLLLLLIGNIAFSFYINSKVDEIVVVDVIKVFNAFNLKKDLEGRVEHKLNDYTAEIDSLKGIVDNLKKEGPGERTKAAAQALYLKQVEAQQVYELSNKNINEQVWKRLNPMIDAYAKKNNYRLVVGANGMGGVLYTQPAIDKTEEFIQYVNASYEKGN